MNRENKILIAIGVFLLATIIYFGFGFTQTTGEVIGEDELSKYHTVAICDDDGYCQDWMVWCENGSVVERILLEGSDYAHGSDWVDPRNEEEKRLCP